MTITKRTYSYSLLFELQHDTCFYCSRKLDPIGYNKLIDAARNGFTRDHFFPKSWGNTLQGNTVLSCPKCNRKKKDHFPTREEVLRFHRLWSHFREGSSIDLSDFVETQSYIDKLTELVGPRVDTRYII